MITTDLLSKSLNPIDQEKLLESYKTYLEEAGYFLKGRLWGARTFLRRFPNLVEWLQVPLNERLALDRHIKCFLNYLFLTHALLAPIDWLLNARPQLGHEGKRLLQRETHKRFIAAGRRLNYSEIVLRRAFHALLYIMAFTGKEYVSLTEEDIDAFEDALGAYKPSQGRRFYLSTFTGITFCLRIILFHDGVLPNAPVQAKSRKPHTREELWNHVPSQKIRHTVFHYLDQISLIRRPATVTHNEKTLRFFFSWLAKAYPDVDQISSINRSHIEAYKTYLGTAKGPKGKPYQINTNRSRLGELRSFFVQLMTWEWEEAPKKLLIFDGDFPNRDKPLPRFLDDVQASALLQTARNSTDLFTRVCVETLLRTGLRRGEFINLRVDSVVKIGSAFWLRVPLGKLHNDRYIPVHPQVKLLFDEWVEHRGNQDWTPFLFVEYGRRITVSRVDEIVSRMARIAGIKEKVSPHRLRHTIATQAINRGMSLESIAALLGHRSLSMTLIYARISNRIVQDEYFAVSEKLDHLYSSQSLQLPEKDEGPGMKKLRHEMQWRMLGNGYCTRDGKLECEFETICESCPCFITTHEFLPTLKKQLTDAQQKGQAGRAKIYAQLIEHVAA